jgi:hypothetical protein
MFLTVDVKVQVLQATLMPYAWASRLPAKQPLRLNLRAAHASISSVYRCGWCIALDCPLLGKDDQEAILLLKIE